MNIKKLVLCIVITMVFSFGIGTIGVLADETQMNKELHTSELGFESESESIDRANEILEESEQLDDKVNELIEINEVAKDIEEIAVEETTVKETTVEETTVKESKEVEEVIEEKGILGATKEFEADEEITKTEKNTKTVKAEKAKSVKAKTKVVEEPKYTKSELRLLAALIYAESGNQSYKGKLAVANVVLNRVDSKQFSHVNTIKEVVYDKKWGIQFSVIKKNSNGVSPLNKALDLYDDVNNKKGDSAEAMLECIKAAKAALNGKNNIGSYLYFSRSSSYLRNKYSNHTIIGAHIFYNTK